MADMEALWRMIPSEMREALNSQAGLKWTMSDARSDEADEMHLAIATQEQQDAIIDVIDDESSAMANGLLLNLFAADLSEMTSGELPTIMKMRQAWNNCTPHTRDFLSAFDATLDRPSRLHYLLLDVEEVVKEIHDRLNGSPGELTRKLDVVALKRLHLATAPATEAGTKKLTAMSTPQMALQLEVSRASIASSAAMGTKRHGDEALVSFLRSKRGCRGKTVGVPGESRNDLETKLHSKWSSEATLILKELDFPIVAVAAETADGNRVMTLRFMNHRASTIEKRVKLWRRLKKIWLQPHEIRWPSRTQLIDLLEGTGQMSAARTWPDQVLGTMAFLEDTGGVSMAQKLSEDSIVISHARALTTELSSPTGVKRQAPPLPIAVILALELYVVDPTNVIGMRLLAWVRLVKSWAGLRYHDHLGMEAGSLRLYPDGLTLWLSRTKTSGPGKKVSRLPVFVHKDAYLGVKKWLVTGVRLFTDLNVRETRDYLVPSLESNFAAARDTPMLYAEALVSDRLLLGLLKTPAMNKDNWQPTKYPLMPEELLGFFSEHSERHFLPRLSIAAGFSREERDYLGRWSPSGADSYVIDAEHVVTKIQKTVAMKLRMGDPEMHRNRNEATAMRTYLTRRGLDADHILHLMSALEPKLNCMTPEIEKNLDSEDEGIKDGDSDIEGEILQTSEPIVEVGYYPYWMARASRKLHRTGATTCPWNPKGVATCVWIEGEADAKSQALTYCKKCWPAGFEEEASDSEPLIDIEIDAEDSD